MKIKENDIVMCTVKSIEGTTVFLDIEGNGQGSMVMSEVAAGRIRNLREYVFPNKKVVCKVLKVDSDNHIQLSLRRVTGKEREEAEEKYKKERTLKSLLKTVLKDPEKVIESIKEKHELGTFFDEIQEKPAILEKFMKKEDADKLYNLISEKEEREKEAKKNFILKTTLESGVKDIKEILNVPESNINYLGSSTFSISIIGKDFKEANTKLGTILEKIEKHAKEKKAIFELK